jgi:hypothetical protein
MNLEDYKQHRPNGGKKKNINCLLRNDSIINLTWTMVAKEIILVPS